MITIQATITLRPDDHACDDMAIKDAQARITQAIGRAFPYMNEGEFAVEVSAVSKLKLPYVDELADLLEKYRNELRAADAEYGHVRLVCGPEGWHFFTGTDNDVGPAAGLWEDDTVYTDDSRRDLERTARIMIRYIEAK